MRRNKLREMMKEDKPTIGVRVLSGWPGIVEVIGHTGAIDYVEFLGTYAPWDLYDLENFARAVELFDMSSMMKIDENCRAFLAQRAVGSGIQNVLFTNIRTAEDARECVRIVKPETPEIGGLHGCLGSRNVGYVMEGGSPEYVKAINDSVIAMMIEKKEAVDNLEEILSVKGIDMVQFGPTDYSLTIGLPGQVSHSETKEAELITIKTALKRGVRVRVEIGDIHGSNIENIQKYLDLGVRDFSLPSDVFILYQCLKENGENLRKILSEIYGTSQDTWEQRVQ